MDVRALNSGFGVELLDFDANSNWSDADAQQFRALFRQNSLVVIRDQSINVETQARIVGLVSTPAIESTTGEIFSFASTKPNEYVSGRNAIPFHADYAYTYFGPIHVISLYGLVVEDAAEPTVFTSGIVGARNLPAALRARLLKMKIVQCTTFAGQGSGGGRVRASRNKNVPAGQFVFAEHPAIRPHPVTGEEVILINAFMTSHFVGLSEEESDTLFAEVAKYHYREDNLYQHDWKRRDLVIWDNVAIQHARAPIERSSERTLRRVVGNPVSIGEISKHVAPDPTKFTYHKHDPAEALRT